MDEIKRRQEETHELAPTREAPAPPRRKGWPLVAWLILLALVGYIVYRNMQKAEEDPSDRAAWAVTVEMQGRYLVGSSRVLDALSKANPGANAANKGQLVEAAKELNRGSYSQRIRYAILVGELEGPAKAREALAELEQDRLEKGLEARDVSIETVQLLSKLYAGYEKNPDAPDVQLDADAQQTLRQGLRWFGDLALAPAGGDAQARNRMLAPALRTAIGIMSVGVLIVLCLFAGVVVLLVFVVLASMGKLRPALQTGSGHGGVYAETFTAYMVLFFGLHYGLSLLKLPSPFSGVAMVGAMFASLLALAWPVLRGISWQQVREDIGLNFAGRPIVNVLLGPVTQLTALPLLGIGILIMFLLLKLAGVDTREPGSGPSHPIIGVALDRDVWKWILVFVMAVIGAPIIEEIMFRGVLYRHLREATGRFGTFLSVVCSVLVSGFVFAVIHPQGWLGVPPLMALATAFALSREYCGSLVPAMVAHGINNGFALCMLLLLMG